MNTNPFSLLGKTQNPSISDIFKDIGIRPFNAETMMSELGTMFQEQQKSMLKGFIESAVNAGFRQFLTSQAFQALKMQPALTSIIPKMSIDKDKLEKAGADIALKIHDSILKDKALSE